MYFKDKTELFIYMDDGVKLVTYVDTFGRVTTVLSQEAINSDKEIKVRLKYTKDLIQRKA